MLIHKISKILRRDYRRFKDDIYYQSLKLLNPNGLIIREIQGSKMYLNLADKGISRELALRGIREERGTEIMYEILKTGQVIVDIGANIGYYVLMESKIVGPTGKIYAIEPVPDNVTMLRKNIELNGYDNIEVFCHAMGSSDTVSKIYLSDRCNWHSMIQRNDNGTSLEVPVYTLDTFLSNKLQPNLVRMDVEGFETEIIKGMVKTLSNTPELMLFIELHPHIMEKHDVISLLETLRMNGFDVLMAADRREMFSLTIDELLRDGTFLDGTKGGLLVFFEKKGI